MADDGPAAAELTVDLTSLEVLGGEGGLKPLSGPDIKLIRRNALKCLHADQFPRIRFHADAIDNVGNSDYRVRGSLEINGTTHSTVIGFRVDDLGDAWRLSGQTDVSQTEFGMKPYSMLAGTLKVADTVTVSVKVTRAKND